MSEVNKIVYDPNKSYKWTFEQTFEINGAELDILLKSLQANFEGNLFNAHALQFEAYKALNLVIKRNVESGKITEQLPVTPSSEPNEASVEWSDQVVQV